MRIYKREVQEHMFKALGFSAEEAHEKFGFLLDAFDYGTPPHGGFAFGFDRLVMLLTGRTNLRETIAFPKTASATDLLCDAPSKWIFPSSNSCISARFQRLLNKPRLQPLQAQHRAASHLYKTY